VIAEGRVAAGVLEGGWWGGAAAEGGGSGAVEGWEAAALADGGAERGGVQTSPGGLERSVVLSYIPRRWMAPQRSPVNRAFCRLGPSC
jgi:hypothetical protein